MLRSRSRALRASVAVAMSTGTLLAGTSFIGASSALAACTGTIYYTNTSTKVVNDSQCVTVRAAIEAYSSGGVPTYYYGAEAVNQSIVAKPSGTTYIRNGMGLRGCGACGYSWTYYVYG